MSRMDASEKQVSYFVQNIALGLSGALHLTHASLVRRKDGAEIFLPDIPNFLGCADGAASPSLRTGRGEAPGTLVPHLVQKALWGLSLLAHLEHSEAPLPARRSSEEGQKGVSMQKSLSHLTAPETWADWRRRRRPPWCRIWPGKMSAGSAREEKKREEKRKQIALGAEGRPGLERLLAIAAGTHRERCTPRRGPNFWANRDCLISETHWYFHFLNVPTTGLT